MNRTSFIFITGTGRTGTTWLCNFIRKHQDQTLQVLHEPCRKEIVSLAHSYLKEYKELDTNFWGLYFQKINERYGTKPTLISICGGTSILTPYFSNCNIKHKRLIHLIRDPKNVVRSYYSRFVVSQHRINKFGNGTKLGLFNFLCRMYTQNHLRVHRYAYRTFRFEDLVSKEKQIIKLVKLIPHLKFNKTLWNQTKDKIINHYPSRILPKYELPKYPNWPPEYIDVFKKHCTEISKKFKYSL